MSTDLTKEVDIAIIGAGTAGCVLASRLSANPSLSVLLLEAGEDHSDDARVYTPARAKELLGDKHIDWAFTSTERHLYHLDQVSYNNSAQAQPGKLGREMPHPRGKAVGGTSVINSFALINPSAAEIDAWAELGNEGWDWNGTKDYFRIFQTITPPDPSIVADLYLAHNFTSSGGSGPVQATFPLTATPLHKAWLEAFRSLDLATATDPLEGRALGGGITTNHISPNDRERSHAGVAYLTADVNARKNLCIVTGAMVQRILFDKNSCDSKAAASCVIYTRAGRTHQVKVRREVIVAAGAFGTPQLLELSGIGNGTLLRKHGIDVVYENTAVGENLQDHIRAGLSFESTERVADAQPEPSRKEAEKLYMNSRSGPWADMAAWLFAYMPLAALSTQEEMQALEAKFHESLISDGENVSAAVRKHYDFVSRTLFSSAETTATAYLIRKAVTPVPGPELEAGKCITFCAMLSHPLSRGSVHIQSPEAKKKPTVVFNYYRNSLDVDVHARHLLALQALAKNRAFAPMIKPDGARYPLQLDLQAARSFLRRTATTNYHPCGTCAMMPKEIGGVVDSRLKVYGTTNVRVVDASVFPIIPRGNIISTVYAVAEKSADILLEDLGLGGTS